MCLVLPARVVSVSLGTAKVLLHGEQQPVSASIELVPHVQPGDFALVDRGMILRVIDAAEAAAILAIYEEMDELLQQDESVHA